MSELPNEMRQASEHLVGVANGLTRRYGTPEATNLLWSAALALTLAAMTRADTVSWLRETADKLEAAGNEVAN